MTLDPSSDAHAITRWPELTRVRRAIVVLDVVESVRLMEQDEPGFISRWQGFVDAVQRHHLPGTAGRVVKSLGDGLMLEFERTPAAVDCALDAMSALQASESALPPGRRIVLRGGVHCSEITRHELDVFGKGVNLAARLMSLAQPGDLVGSAEVRDEVADRLELSLHDLGECYVKHVDEPVRAFSIRRARPAPADAADTPAARADGVDLRPMVAVIPLDGGDDIGDRALGEAFADDVIAALSVDAGLRVLSRLSTAPLRSAGPALLDQLRLRLKAAYALSGTLRRLGGTHVRVRVELMDVGSAEAVWAQSVTMDERDLFAGQDRLVPETVQAIGAAVATRELKRVRQLPLPNLAGYTLLSGGTSLLHRQALPDFARAREVLEYLHERHPTSAPPLAMKAKWHVLRVIQGWTDDRRRDGLQARQAARQAVHCDASDAFSLAVDGLAAALIESDLDLAEQRYRCAVDANPQEPYAHALYSSLHCYRDRVDEANAAADLAATLSPLDPAIFLFETHRALARLAALRVDEGIDAARRALVHNAAHLPALRLLIIGLMLGGRHDEARAAAREHMRRSPSFSMAAYRRLYPGRDAEHAERHAQALEQAGLPR